MSYTKDYSYSTTAAETLEVTTSKAYRDMFGWMACGLGISALTAYFIFNSSLIYTMYSTGMMWGLMIASLVMVFVLSGMIHKMSFGVATLCFAAYSVIMGAWTAPVLLVYTMSSVVSVFAITAGTFAIMALIGHVVKKDLSTMGRVLTMALIGIIIASVVNIFMGNAMLDYIISYAAVLIFCGLTAYDVQKFKQLIEYSAGNGEAVRKIALLGALSLYLDFLNLFLHLLSILGGRRD